METRKLLIVALAVLVIPAVFAATQFTLVGAPAGYFGVNAMFPAYIFTLKPTTDTTIAGTPPDVGTSLTNTNPWTDVYFYDGGTSGTWESTSDWIGKDDDADGVYTAAADVNVDCDGNISIDVNTAACAPLSPGVDLNVFSGEENICTDSLTSPTCVFYDPDGDCNFQTGTVQVLLDVGGTSCSSLGSNLAIEVNSTSGWAYYDEDGSGGYTLGDDIYINYGNDSAPTFSEGPDTTIAGTPPADGTSLTNTNPWTDVYFYDGGTSGTWESTSDWIGVSTDTVFDNNADTIQELNVINLGTATSADINLYLFLGNSCGGTGYQLTPSTGVWTVSPALSFTGENNFTICALVLEGATDGATIQLEINVQDIKLLTGSVPATAAANPATQTIDVAPPTVSINPDSVSWANTPIEVNITAQDDVSGVSSIEYNIIPETNACPSDPNAYTSYSCGGASPCTVTVTINTDGSWKICYYAKDEVNNVSVTEYNGPYQHDSTPPSGTIDSPAAAYVLALSEINGTATDALSGIANVQLLIYDVNDSNYWDGSAWTPTITPLSVTGTNPWEYNTANITWTDYHTYEINVLITDVAGNQQTITKEFTFDSDPPDVNIVSPASAIDLNAKSINIQWVFTEPLFASASVDCEDDGTPEYITSTPTDTNYICTYSADGTYTVRVTVTDLAGNKGSDTRQVRVDTYPPSITFNYGDYTPGTTATTSVTVTVSATDSGSGVARLYVAYVSSSDTCPAKGSAIYTSSIGSQSITLDTEGSWKICAYAMDNAGNETNIVESGTIIINFPRRRTFTITDIPPISLTDRYTVRTISVPSPATNLLVDIETLRPDLPVASVQIVTREPISRATIFVAELKSLPKDVPEPPAKNIVEYFSVSVDDSTKDVLQHVLITFRVPIESVQRTDAVRLMHYHSKWIEITPEFLAEKNGMYYFQAEVPNLSYFAVTEIETVSIPQEQQPEQPEQVVTSVQPETQPEQQAKQPQPAVSEQPAQQEQPTGDYTVVAIILALAIVSIAIYYTGAYKRILRR